MNAANRTGWRPSVAQITIFAIAFGLSLIFLVFMVQSYLQGAGTSQGFIDKSEALATIANIQRHTVLLFVHTQDWLNNPTLGKAEIEKQRALLNSQIRVLRPLLAPKDESAQKITELTAALQTYDEILTNLGETPSPAAIQTARPQLMALLKKMDEDLVKRAYDSQERQFVILFGSSLKQQERSHQLLLGSSVAFIVIFAIGTVFYLRSERRTYDLRQQQLHQLESAVSERTRALQLAAQVSQRIAAIRNQAQIVVEVVEQLKQTFNYYHAHIYLFDEKEENLVMAGGTGQVGQTLLQRRHSIPRGKGLVGRAAENKQAVLVADTHADPAWLPNPLLPETRAEVAVPILFGGRVLGVLDVQNDRTASLSELDALLIGTVADQVGIALENLRANQLTEQLFQDYQTLIETSPAAIAILDAESGLFVQANPQMLELFELTPEDVGKTGPIQLSPPTQPDGQPSETAATARIQRALQQGGAVFEWIHRTRSGREFRSEIRLSPAPDREGRPMLNAIITDITARYQAEQQARRRAEREAILNRVTQQIQSATRIEDALQLAVRELGHALGSKPVMVAIQPAALPEEKETQR